MFWLWFLSSIPICIGVGLIILHKRIHWAEWIIGAAIALITAGIFHFWAYRSQVGDWEVHSGSIVRVKQFSRWHEYYEYAVYRTETISSTDSKGNTTTTTIQVFDHWEPDDRWHDEYWMAYSNINTEYSISKDKYIYLVGKFGGDYPIQGQRTTSEHNSKMIGGDPNDYEALNKTRWIEPVNKSVYFENRVRCTQNIFNRIKITEKEAQSLKLFSYPYFVEPWISNRLMGTAQKYIKFSDWEILNGKLGPIKFINLICVGFDSPDSGLAEKQMGYWQTPKKNDLIIMFGTGWSRVYSFSDSELCKQNIQTLLLNPNDKDLLSKLEREIMKNYKLVDFHKFDYLSIQPKMHHIIWYFVVLILTQIGLYCIFHYNEF